MKRVLVLIILLTASVTCRADLPDKLARLRGYTVVADVTVTGWVDRMKPAILSSTPTESIYG